MSRMNTNPMYDLLLEGSETRVQPQSRSRIQSQDQKATSNITIENFRIPKIYYFDLDTLSEEKKKQIKEKPSDFFNYGTHYSNI